VIDWIKNTIAPPGIDKKNRFAIFNTIGDIMGRVRGDAVKAFNAHFPYLADEIKLEQHGKALFIPRLMHDRPNDFRNRVAAASFFLMRAGSRGFILDLLEERFNNRFWVVEKFLQIHTKVADLTPEEKAWILDLLDSLVDPNVSFEFFNVINVRENMAITERFYLRILKTAEDGFGGPHYDGTYNHDGEIYYDSSGMEDFFELQTQAAPMTDKISIKDSLEYRVKNSDGEYLGNDE